MMRAFQLLACVAVLVATAGQVQAGLIIQVDFEAEVTFVSDVPVLGISASLGDLVSGTFFYDTDAYDTYLPSSAIGIYSSGSSFLAINGHTLASNGSSKQRVFDGAIPDDLFFVQHGVSQGTSPVLVDGVLTDNARFVLRFAGELTGDSLPSLADLAKLNVGRFQIVQEEPPYGSREIRFDNVTSFSATEISPRSRTLLFRHFRHRCVRGWNRCRSSPPT